MSDFDSFVANRRGDTLVNVVIGVVLSMFATPLLGGFVAGYLQQRGRRAGAKVGGIVGAVTVLPALLFMFVIFGFGGFGFMIGGDIGGSIVFLLMMLLFVTIAVVTSLLFPIAAGYVGGIASESADHGRRDEYAAVEETRQPPR